MNIKKTFVSFKPVFETKVIRWDICLRSEREVKSEGVGNASNGVFMCFALLLFFLSIIIRIHHGWLDLKSSDSGLTAASLFICLNCLFSPKFETDFTKLSGRLIVTQKNQNLSEYKKLFSNDCLI